MAIQRVQCPKCQTTMNVAGNMATVQCSGCGNVFPTSPTEAADMAVDPTEVAVKAMASRADDGGDSFSATKAQKTLVACGLAGFLILLFVFFLFLRSTHSTDQSAGSASGSESSASASTSPVQVSDAKEDLSFRVVNVSEAERKRLFREYRTMEKSGFGKAKRIPKGGKAGQSLNNMLSGIADREAELMALNNRLSEDDILQIVAEGKAKGWD